MYVPTRALLTRDFFSVAQSGFTASRGIRTPCSLPHLPQHWRETQTPYCRRFFSLPPAPVTAHPASPGARDCGIPWARRRAVFSENTLPLQSMLNPPSENTRGRTAGALHCRAFRALLLLRSARARTSKPRPKSAPQIKLNYLLVPCLCFICIMVCYRLDRFLALGCVTYLPSKENQLGNRI